MAGAIDTTKGLPSHPERATLEGKKTSFLDFGFSLAEKQLCLPLSLELT